MKSFKMFELRTEEDEKTKEKTKDRKLQVLEKFGKDMTKMAEDGELEPVIGRENEIFQVLWVLSRKMKNNPVIIGEAGVGKTAIVEGIAQRLVNGDCPDILKDMRIYYINMGSLLSGASAGGQLEARVEQLLKELEENKDIILFIDEIHLIVNPNASIDVANMFKPALARGKMRLIGATTYNEFRNSIEKDSALDRRFQKVVIKEPNEEETINILNQIKSKYEEYHNVKYTDDAIEYCVKLSGRYITNRFFPDKAIDLLDEVGAKVRLSNSKKNEVLIKAEKELLAIKKRKVEALKNNQFDEAGQIRKEETNKLEEIDKLTSESKTPAIEINSNEVSNILSLKTGIPVKKLTQDEGEKLLGMEGELKLMVIGQDEAVTKISKFVRRSRVGLKDKNRPSGVFLFLGSTGTGKTHTVKMLAKYIFGSESDLVRIDMSEYREKHTMSRLIGCFHPGTMIQLSNGSNKKISDINIGDYVITHLGNKKKVIDKYEYDNTDGFLDSYKISNRNIRLECTPQHEILAIKPGFYNKRIDKKLYNIDNAEFYKSSELNVGDILLYPKIVEIDNDSENLIDLFNYLPDKNKYKVDDNYIWHNLNKVKINRHLKLDTDFARLGGYYISEGGCSKNKKSIKFTFNKNEEAYINEVVYLIKKIFSNDINIKIETINNSTHIIISSRIINLLLSNIFGRTCYEKKIPNILSSNELFPNLLETMIYGDGSKTINRKITYTTVSKELAYQLNTYLKKFGYSTQFNMINGHIDKRGYKSSDIYKIILTGFNISKINDFLPNYKLLNSDINPKNIQRFQHQDDKYFYYRIIDKSSITYDGKVYDISIDEDSTYIANGISVHNSPPGYVGYNEAGQLTEKIRRNPYSILLLDEIEKAHPDVLNVFLQVFDDGYLTDAQGRKVDFKNTIIIMTSNVGAAAASSASTPVGFGDKKSVVEENKKSIIKAALYKYFAPEFINRIDEIIFFNPLEKESVYKIIDIEIEKLSKKLKDMNPNYSLTITNNVKDFLMDVGYDQSMGARPLKRAIQSYIEDPISDEILKKKIKDKIEIDYNKEEKKLVINGELITERKRIKNWRQFKRLF